MGVVYVPVTGVLYAGTRDAGGRTAWVEDADGRRPISTRGVDSSALTVVGSRRHGSDALEALVGRLGRHFGSVDMTSMGSSLKICLVAEGRADLYPRLAPTCEWDTAAAQAVVTAAGHTLREGDVVFLSGIVGPSALNAGGTYTVSGARLRLRHARKPLRP